MTEDLQVTQPDLRERIAQEAQTLEAQARTLQVTNAEQYAYAASLLTRIRERRKEWTDYWAPHLEGALKAKREAEANRKRIVTDIEARDVPLATSEQTVATLMGTYQDKVDADLKAEQARLQLAADQAAAEQALLEAVAIEAEASLASSPEEALDLIAEADSMIAAPIRGATVHVASPLVKVPGYSRPVRWKAEIVDLPVLLHALIGKNLDKPLTDELTTRIMEACMVPLNQRATSMKSALRVPGVRAVKDVSYRLK